MKRTFIAIPVPSEYGLSEKLKIFSAGNWGANIRWVPSHQWHFTLAFLGETSYENEVKVKSILSSLVAGIRAFDIRFDGIGLFPHKRNPKVIWVGIEKSPLIESIANDIQQQLKIGGVEYDAKPFVPHLTIGRVKQFMNPEDFRRRFESCVISSPIETPLNELVFYQSVLEKHGPVYQTLASWKLA